uniref:Uncharacterized protein n=1 Tax=Zea mays TaxID=4577 RepID=A0A804MP00_MAIZE
MRRRFRGGGGGAHAAGGLRREAARRGHGSPRPDGRHRLDLEGSRVLRFRPSHRLLGRQLPGPLPLALPASGRQVLDDAAAVRGVLVPGCQDGGDLRSSVSGPAGRGRAVRVRGEDGAEDGAAGPQHAQMEDASGHPLLVHRLLPPPAQRRRCAEQTRRPPIRGAHPARRERNVLPGFQALGGRRGCRRRRGRRGARRGYRQGLHPPRARGTACACPRPLLASLVVRFNAMRCNTLSVYRMDPNPSRRFAAVLDLCSY